MRRKRIKKSAICRFFTKFQIILFPRENHIFESLCWLEGSSATGGIYQRKAGRPHLKNTQKSTIAQLHIPEIQKYTNSNVGGILIVPLKVSAPNCPVYLLSEKFCLISASFQVCSFVLVLRGVEIQPRNGQIANVKTLKLFKL